MKRLTKADRENIVRVFQSGHSISTIAYTVNRNIYIIEAIIRTALKKMGTR